jgi:hypothetical protein
MPNLAADILRPAARACHTVASGVISGFCRRIGQEEIAARLSRRPAREQALITAATLAGLFLTSLLFAQFGLIGMLVFLLLVILLIR